MRSIYLIRNKINGKVYIGKTIRKISIRFREHLSGCNSTLYLSRAIFKHGADNFETLVIYKDAVTDGHLNMLERMYIRMFNSNNPRYGYNLTGGGDGLTNPSEATRKKMRKPHVISPEGYKKLVEVAKRNTSHYKMSSKARRKMSRLMKEKRAKWGNKYCSHSFSEESRDKMSSSRKKYLGSLTKKERSRIFGRYNQNLLGHTHSVETRRKISIGTKRGMYLRSLAA